MLTVKNIKTALLSDLSLQRPSATRIIDRLGRKSYQKKRHLIGYKSYQAFFKNILLDANYRPSNIHSLHTYVVR